LKLKAEGSKPIHRLHKKLKAENSKSKVKQVRRLEGT
jgi:hypothetical protein